MKTIFPPPPARSTCTGALCSASSPNRPHVQNKSLWPGRFNSPSSALPCSSSGNNFNGVQVLNKLGKYEIRRELGRGAMGIVYEGFDPFIERTVAIKTIQKSMLDKSEAREILSRFRREAQAAGRLTHPNIVSVYEYGEDGDVAYIAMEFIVGIELKEHFDKTVRFKINDSTKIMTQLLDALEYSHSRGVVHRDIKPSNILITKDGQVKIADFGIAKIESSDLTQVGTVLGTPSYMSPEQFMGLAVDHRSDIYSAGVILYQFLTGERPFTGSNMTIIMHKVLNQLPAPPRALNPDLPEALQKVVEKAIAKRPEDRFQTAAEFMKALKLAAEESPARAAQASPSDATITISNPARDKQKNGAGQSSFTDFSPVDFEERLKESQREADRKSGNVVVEKKPDDSSWDIKLEFDQFVPSKETEAKTAAPIPVKLPDFQAGSQSGLLAGLAQEAKERLDSRQTTLQASQAKARRVDDALNRIVKFFHPFIKHVNDVEPAINRTYRYDARTIYSNLKWRGAVVESRKQSISESALMDYVVFSVNLFAPEPVLLKRPWGPIETLKKELHHLRLRVVDDAETGNKKPKQEWLETQLAADFPMQIRFQGNYTETSINVMSRNVGAFGVTAYKLEPDDVTPAFLDDLGLFLLGRSDKLPMQLRSDSSK
ncbi:MAG TPA: serine/threonine-protein kinase [Gallionella sp.]|nr:serine/threonine-protein kinase [Gallionella sp.]